MERQPVVYSIKRWQLLAVLSALVFLVVSLPIGVYAATGQVVNLQDALNKTATGSGRVINQRLITNSCDISSTSITGASCTRISNGRTLVGDGTGNLTVDGNVIATPGMPIEPAFLSGNAQDNNTSTFINAYLHNAAGKRFVGETLQVRADLPTGQALYECAIQLYTAGDTVIFQVPMDIQSSHGGFDYYVGTIPMKVYIDANTDSILQCTRNSTADLFHIFATMTGYRA